MEQAKICNSTIDWLYWTYWFIGTGSFCPWRWVFVK